MRQSALHASKIVTYGASAEIEAGGCYEWGIDKGAPGSHLARRCIIRAAQLLDDITAYEAGAAAARRAVCDPLPGVRARAACVVTQASVFASSLAYFDQIRATRLPAALIQGQRDFFGSTYLPPGERRVCSHLWARWSSESGP